MIDPSRDILEIQQNNHIISAGTVQPGASLPAHLGYLLNRPFPGIHVWREKNEPFPWFYSFNTSPPGAQKSPFADPPFYWNYCSSPKLLWEKNGPTRQGAHLPACPLGWPYQTSTGYYSYSFEHIALMLLPTRRVRSSSSFSFGFKSFNLTFIIYVS